MAKKQKSFSRSKERYKQSQGARRAILRENMDANPKLMEPAHTKTHWRWKHVKKSKKR